MPEVRGEDLLAIARTLASAEREMEDVAVWCLAGCDENTSTRQMHILQIGTPFSVCCSVTQLCQTLCDPMNPNLTP